MKEQVKALWKLCFKDSDEFIDFYFEKRYTNEINMAIESGNKVISALQLIPYPMTFNGMIIQTSYISGACTHPDFQGKGVMQELLSQSFAKMYQSRILLSTLIPAEDWLFGYYAKAGYASVFDYTIEIVKDLHDLKIPVIHQTNKFVNTVYEYFNKKMLERDYCVQHTEDDFRIVIADITLSGGTIAYTVKDKKITGVAIMVSDDNSIKILELLSDNEETEMALITGISIKYPGSLIKKVHPINNNTSDRKILGMARIINVYEMLRLYAQLNPELKINMEVSDEYISANNGYYNINNGSCKYSGKKSPGKQELYTIAQLTEKLFKTNNAYMSLMLN